MYNSRLYSSYSKKHASALLAYFKRIDEIKQYRTNIFIDKYFLLINPYKIIINFKLNCGAMLF